MAAATNDPTDDPQIILGSKSYSLRAFKTPKWYLPKVAPPLNISAVCPYECLVSAKNWSLASNDILDGFA